MAPSSPTNLPPSRSHAQPIAAVPARAIASLLLAATLSLLTPSPAHSAISYQYEASSPSVSYTPNLSVNIYLRETLTAGSTSALATKGGLFGAGFRISYVGGGSLSILGISGNPSLFSGPGTGFVSPTTATYLQAVSLESTSGPLPDPSSRILLGTVIFSSSPTSLPALFEISRLDSLGGNTLTFTAEDLDLPSQDFTPTTPTPLMIHSTIPEPTPLTLSPLLLFPLLLRRPRRAP